MENNKSLFEESPGDYWDNRYLHDETEWDMKQVSPPLKAYIDGLTNKDLKILIPGCGNAYEAEYLLNKGFRNVTLIDLSKVITERLKEKYLDKTITIINQDFFEHNGKYDLILEQTFFCALHPSLRERYVEKCFDLLHEGGKLAGVLFNKRFSDTEPPFIASDEDYRNLFGEKFTSVTFENCNNSIAPRLGYELFFELEKQERG